MNEIKGIITGDIVDSSRIKGKERDTLLCELERIGVELTSQTPFKLDIFRGDSFQIETQQPEDTIRIAVLFRTALKAATPPNIRHIWDARISVGIGKVDYEGERISLSDGEAYRLSGRGLDDIGKRRLSVETPWPEVNDELAVSTAFADAIISEWSRVQSAAAYLKIGKNFTQKEIAEATGKTQQNISKILASSQEELISKYLKRCKRVITEKVACV